MSSLLFESYRLGALDLPNRMVMAPLTRSRSGQPGNVPTQLNVLYYQQRASAGLIVSEGTQISPQGQGYAWTPGIHSADQVAGWRRVTEAVHAAGGRIFNQLWHVGRVSHPALQPGNVLPVAPSAVACSGEAFIVDERGHPAFVPFVTPRALSTEELPGIVRQYVDAARNALAAGFDGVEIHSANGYLLDQFLHSATNQRTDAYGGGVDHRARLLLEVTEAVCGAVGASRVGVRLSPRGRFNDMADDDPDALFCRVAELLSGFGMAYLHLVDSSHVVGNITRESPDPLALDLVRAMRRHYAGTVIVCGGYDRETAEAALREGRADLVAFGRSFLANPDLPRRFQENAALNAPDRSTFYGGGAHGYVDYPSLAMERGEEPMPDVAALDASVGR